MTSCSSTLTPASWLRRPASRSCRHGRIPATTSATRCRARNLFISFANGATEKLVKVPGNKADLIDLDRGTLALTGRHFILVTEPEGGWLAGSGQYKREEHDIKFEAMRWFEVRGGKARYAADMTFEATFDGKMLKLRDGPGFRVSR